MTARILVVDDLAANARLLEARLALEYYELRTVDSGLAALDVARQWQPDLIVLDVMMPGIDGYETCQRLKAMRETKHIPVILVTALEGRSERLRGLECGADDFFTRPISNTTLLARLRSLTRLKRALDDYRSRSDMARSLGVPETEPAELSLAGTRALLVDDMSLDRNRVEQAMAAEGVELSRVGSEREALACVNAARFDLLIVSLALAGEDPLRLIARLRSSDAARDLPLLLIVDPEMDEVTLRSLDMGGSDWISRPLDEAELRVRARNQIRRKLYADMLQSDMEIAMQMLQTDPLTGLYNRRFLERQMARLLDEQRGASGGGASGGGVAVLMIDMDHFKSVNDKFGHQTGDQALRQVATILRDQTREMDAVARYGGEEFAISMPDTALSQAARVGERIRAAVAASADLAHPLCRLTVSVGVAASDGRAMKPEALLHEADQALYVAKRGGRNRVEVAALPHHAE